jgi:undecaprenyl-diphosphatase
VLGPASGATRRVAPIVAAAAVVLFAIVAVMVAIGAADAFDKDVRLAIYRLSGPWQPWLTSVVRALSELGSVTWLLVQAAIVALVVCVLNRRRIAFSLVLTLLTTMLVNTALKLIFARERPEPFYGDFLDSHSFPSGHSAFSCCFYMSIAAIAAAYARTNAQRAGIFAGAAVLIAAIGFSRVYLGVHYPTDVLGGWLVAIACAAIARIIDRPKGTKAIGAEQP